MTASYRLVTPEPLQFKRCLRQAHARAARLASRVPDLGGQSSLLLYPLSIRHCRIKDLLRSSRASARMLCSYSRFSSTRLLQRGCANAARMELGHSRTRSSIKLTISHCTLRLVEAGQKSRGAAGTAGTG